MGLIDNSAKQFVDQQPLHQWGREGLKEAAKSWVICADTRLGVGRVVRQSVMQRAYAAWDASVDAMRRAAPEFLVSVMAEAHDEVLMEATDLLDEWIDDFVAEAIIEKAPAAVKRSVRGD